MQIWPAFVWLYSCNAIQLNILAAPFFLRHRQIYKHYGWLIPLLVSAPFLLYFVLHFTCQTFDVSLSQNFSMTVAYISSLFFFHPRNFPDPDSWYRPRIVFVKILAIFWKSLRRCRGDEAAVVTSRLCVSASGIGGLCGGVGVSIGGWRQWDSPEKRLVPTCRENEESWTVQPVGVKQGWWGSANPATEMYSFAILLVACVRQ